MSLFDRFKSDPNLKRLQKTQKARERAHQEQEKEDKRSSSFIEEPPPLRYVKKQTWQRKSHGS